MLLFALSHLLFFHSIIGSKTRRGIEKKLFSHSLFLLVLIRIDAGKIERRGRAAKAFKKIMIKIFIAFIFL
jgi:hypothetical protein